MLESCFLHLSRLKLILDTSHAAVQVLWSVHVYILFDSEVWRCGGAVCQAKSSVPLFKLRDNSTTSFRIANHANSSQHLSLEGQRDILLNLKED